MVDPAFIPEPEDSDIIKALERLDKDLKKSTSTLSAHEVQQLVSFYYKIQKARLQSAGQLRSSKDENPHDLLEFLYANLKRFENDIKVAMGSFTEKYRITQWMRSIVGVGPVISAGIIAHLDIRKAKYPQRFIRYAGLDPTLPKPKKGQKRAWNAKLKRLMFIASDCFMKFQNHKNQFYGTFYVEWKEEYSKRSKRGDYKERCITILEEKNWRKETDAYKAYSKGVFPVGHIHMMALRKIATLFLCHIHHMMWLDHYGTSPPDPFIVFKKPEKKDHIIQPPNCDIDMFEGLTLKDLYKREVTN